MSRGGSLWNCGECILEVWGSWNKKYSMPIYSQENHSLKCKIDSELVFK